jgi:hypothetical protein
MTICVAAIGRTGLIIAAADRMKTGGDIEFEPRKNENPEMAWGSGSKIFPITTSITALTAGDASLQAEILQHVFYDTSARIKSQPDEWWRVEDVANLYVKHYDRIKRQRAVSAILAPLNLDSDKFLEQQSVMSADLVASITRDLQSFDMPQVITIFVGVDTIASHMFITSNCNPENVCRITCSDNTGFAAIGSGSRHALSQFMLVGYHRQAPTSETLFQTYLAKKRAEIAPGVGKETDMFTIGPGLGLSSFIRTEIMSELDLIYRKYDRAEKSSRKKASESAEAFERKIMESRPKQQTTDTAAPSPEVESTPPDSKHDR